MRTLSPRRRGARCRALREIEARHLEPQVAADDAAHVEQVLADARLRLRVALDLLQARASLRARRSAAKSRARR